MSSEVFSTTLYSSQFLSDSCSGAPLSTYTFFVSNIENYDPPVNETWSTTYYALTQYAFYNECGNLQTEKMPSNGACCFSFLDASAAPYQSVITFDAADNAVDYMVKAANGQKYCYLNAGNDSTALLGYQEAYFLASDVCIDSRFKCSPSGDLFVYDADSNCDGENETLKLDLTLSSKNSTFLGSVTGKFMTIEGAPKEVYYTTFGPAYLAVPNFKSGVEIFTLICLIGAYASSFIPLCFSVIELVQDPKKRKILQYSYCANFCLQFVKVCLSTASWAAIFKTTGSLMDHQTVTGIFSALSALFVTLITTFTFIFTFKDMPIYQKALVLSFVVAMHIGLCGSKYFEYYLFQSGTQIKQDVKNWGAALPAWIIFYFIWTNLPPLLIAYTLLRFEFPRSTFLEKVDIAKKASKSLLPCVFVQVLIVILYFVAAQVLNGNIYVPTDRDYLCVPVIQLFLLTLQAYITTVITKSITAIGKVQNKTKSSELSSVISTKMGQSSTASKN